MISKLKKGGSPCGVYCLTYYAEGYGSTGQLVKFPVCSAHHWELLQTCWRTSQVDGKDLPRLHFVM